MKKSQLTISIVMAVALPAIAQAAGPLLTGKDVNEAALIEALTPGELPRTRSFGRDNAVMPAKSASASLLITFATNSAELTAEGKDMLGKVGRALNSDKLTGFKFEIEGHADPRGTDEVNQRLSEARAAAARQYLVQNHNITDERLKAIGKGRRELLNKDNPIAPENRRVTIKTITQ